MHASTQLSACGRICSYLVVTMCLSLLQSSSELQATILLLIKEMVFAIVATAADHSQCLWYPLTWPWFCAHSGMRYRKRHLSGTFKLHRSFLFVLNKRWSDNPQSLKRKQTSIFLRLSFMQSETNNYFKPLPHNWTADCPCSVHQSNFIGLVIFLIAHTQKNTINNRFCAARRSCLHSHINL